MTYVQRGLGNIWKENIMDLEADIKEYKLVGEFLTELKKEFSRGGDKSRKVTELKDLE